MPCGGHSVNDVMVYCDKHPYESIDYEIELLQTEYFMANVNIKSAYRSVAIQPASYKATELMWNIAGLPTYLIDTHMPFGARPSPSVFHHLSKSVKRMMQCYGHHKLAVYQDDFLVIGETYEECLEAWVALVQLLLELVLNISYKKLAAPATDIIFLGICIKSHTMQVSLPSDKLHAIKDCLHCFQHMHRTTKWQL